MLFVRFVHYLGLAMWIGGWLAMSVLAMHARGETAQVRAGVFGLLARVHSIVIGPGAILTLVSGIMWSVAVAGGGEIQIRVAPVGLWVMTVAGFVGGLLIVVEALPTAARLRALAVPTADGQMLPAFEKQRKRLIVVSFVAGVLALVSMFAAVLAP